MVWWSCSDVLLLSIIIPSQTDDIVVLHDTLSEVLLEPLEAPRDPTLRFESPS